MALLTGFEGLGFAGLALTFARIFDSTASCLAWLRAASFAMLVFSAARSARSVATCFSNLFALESWLFLRLPTSFESLAAASSLRRAATCFSSLLMLAEWLLLKLPRSRDSYSRFSLTILS